MAWDLQWGPELDFLLQMQKAGEDPEPLRLCPAVVQKALPTYRAFKRLSAARQRDQGAPLPIAIADIFLYFGTLGPFDLDRRITMLDHIQMMDGQYLADAIERMKKQMEAARSNPQ